MKQSKDNNYQFATECIHAGYQPEPLAGSTQVPLYMSSSYSFETAEAAAESFTGKPGTYVYSRVNNPTNEVLEKRLAKLEGMEAGLACSSGLSALMMVLVTLAQAGDEVLTSPKLYGGSYRQMFYNAPRIGITPVWMDLEKGPEAWAKQITPKTKFMYIETPANPTLHMVDIEAASKVAKAAGIPLVVDNTFCTPYLQQPKALGADVIVHSTTKYLTGNSTALGGAILGSQSYIDSVRLEDYRNLGPTASPFNSWLVLLGIETLPLRMDRHCENAMKLATFLESHSKVQSVNYPGLPCHPQHTLAKKQMKAFGGMLAFEVKGGVEAGKAFLNNLKLTSIVANLGDSRTLAIHPASTTHSPLSAEDQLATGVTPGLIRVSVGLESIDDIITDFDQALG